MTQFLRGICDLEPHDKAVALNDMVTATLFLNQHGEPVDCRYALRPGGFIGVWVNRKRPADILPHKRTIPIPQSQHEVMEVTQGYRD